MGHRDKPRLRQRLVRASRNLLLGLGLGGAATSSYSSTAFDEATAQNTVEAYTAFILSSQDQTEIEQAFCRLRDLDAGAADQAATDYSDQSSLTEGVDFQGCSVTGAARLINI